MLKPVAALCISLLSVTGSFAQEKDPTKEFLDNALLVNINARIMAKNMQSAWNFTSSQLRIPGQPMVVQLNGRNLNVHIVFTPYKGEQDKQILLIAQGQIWIQEEGGAGKYLTSLKSIPVTVGEKFQFYPLGVGDTEAYNIQLEIEILYYRDLVKNNDSPTPKPDPVTPKPDKSAP